MYETKSNFFNAKKHEFIPSIEQKRAETHPFYQKINVQAVKPGKFNKALTRINAG